LGICQIDSVLKATPYELWKKVKNIAGISELDYYKYFADYQIAYGIKLVNVSVIEPIGLDDLRNSISGFCPPQTYRYINADDIKCNWKKNILKFPHYSA